MHCVVIVVPSNSTSWCYVIGGGTLLFHYATQSDTPSAGERQLKSGHWNCNKKYSFQESTGILFAEMGGDSN